VTALAQVPPEQPAAGETESGQVLLNEALQSASILSQKARGTESAAEAKDFAQAVMFLSQVIALLDPSRDEAGIPLEHHANMEQMKADSELQKIKEQAKAQPPNPKKRVTATRDGNRTSYEVDG